MTWDIFKIISNYYSRQMWRGFTSFAVLFVMQVSANPAVGFSIKKNSDNFSVTILGKSIGSILSGDIYCEYDPQYDIEKASLSSPISSLSLGASLNRTGFLLHITISATGTVKLDSTVIAVLEIPFSVNTLNDYAFKIDSAFFTDRGGVKRAADIIPVSVTVPLHSIQKTDVINTNHYYMLNGRKIPQNVIDNYKRKSSGSLVFQKVLYACRRN